MANPAKLASRWRALAIFGPLLIFALDYTLGQKGSSLPIAGIMWAVGQIVAAIYDVGARLPTPPQDETQRDKP